MVLIFWKIGLIVSLKKTYEYLYKKRDNSKTCLLTGKNCFKIWY